MALLWWQDVQHATTLMTLALVDSIDHTLKKLPSLFATVVVDDTQVQAVGKSHLCVARAIDLFVKDAEEVTGSVVSSKKLEIIINDERVRTDVLNNKVHADALRTCGPLPSRFPLEHHHLCTAGATSLHPLKATKELCQPAQERSPARTV